jgi:uncharacterized membrane protein HdeD (DUF308 family)
MSFVALYDRRRQICQTRGDIGMDDALHPGMTSARIESTLRDELADIARRWPWLLALGVVMIVVGLFALSSGFAATVASVIVIGSYLIVSGIAHLATAFSAYCWRGRALHLLTGVLAGVTGFVLIARPGIGAGVLTLVFAILFLVSGGMRIVSAVVERFPNWGWSLASGVLSAVLGIMVMASWPLSGTWFLGLYLGIDFIFSGVTWVALSITLRKLVAPAPRIQPSPV